MALVAGAILASCAVPQAQPPNPQAVTITTANVMSIDGSLRLPSLPEPLSNNAVASVELGLGHYRLYSFMGLLKGRTWRDVTDRAFEYDSRDNAWRELSPVPGGVGRLAATAQTVQGQVYIFGGYTVAEDGTEVSTPEVYRFDPVSRIYTEVTHMPVAVDDQVSGVYRDRYIYLVSGWSNTDNVSNVQIFDVESLAWLQATPFPGPPVFGHAGGLVNNDLLICDGVKVVPGSRPGEKRRFVMSDECWLGVIDDIDPARIDWQQIEHHPGPPLYRAASGGFVSNDHPQIILAGGTTNPYNYNGIGYNGDASVPSHQISVFSLLSRRWSRSSSVAAMDWRGIAAAHGRPIVIGGISSIE